MGGMVIVGAGECGVRAAFTLREEGYEGTVTLVGEEPHLPYERPPLSKNAPPAVKLIAEETRYRDLSIDLLRGTRGQRVDRENRRLVLADGRTLDYDRLLIATGARARRFAGMEKARTLRSVGDADAILSAIGAGTKLVIIGGGFIGLELAATARGLGAEVTVLEAADRLMARAVPAEIAAMFEDRHRQEGVRLRLGAKVEALEEHAVVLADGSRIEADIVVAGVGAEPITGLAADAGLAVDNGIVVDRCLRTADSSIFAAGDCCSFPYRGAPVRLESWRCAQDQGAHAARAMLGCGDSFVRVPWFWSDQYDLGLQVAGLALADRPFLRREVGDGAFVLFQLDGQGRVLSASGVGTGNAVARDISIAEKLIERGIVVAPEVLCDPGTRLKQLLKG